MSNNFHEINEIEEFDNFTLNSKYTHPFVRIFNGVCIYLFIILLSFFIYQNDWIAIIILILSRIILFLKLPNFYLPVLIILLIYLLINMVWVESILLIAFIVSSSFSMHYAYKTFKKQQLYQFENDIIDHSYEKPENPAKSFFNTFRSFIGAISLSVFIFFDGIISNICFFLFSFIVILGLYDNSKIIIKEFFKVKKF